MEKAKNTNDNKWYIFKHRREIYMQYADNGENLLTDWLLFRISVRQKQLNRSICFILPWGSIGASGVLAVEVYKPDIFYITSDLMIYWFDWLVLTAHQHRQVNVYIPISRSRKLAQAAKDGQSETMHINAFTT